MPAAVAAWDGDSLVLKKSPAKDFVVLNLTDPQLKSREWAAGEPKRRVLVETIEELVGRVKPDLITISGDVTWAGEEQAYESFANYMDTFHIPWALVWGNHDNQGGAEEVRKVVRSYRRHPYFLYLSGDPQMGDGNYVIKIMEEERPVSALFMVDSHDHMQNPLSTDPKERCYSKLYPSQLDWLERKSAELQSGGFHDGAMILHIPIYAYRRAFAEAYKAAVPAKELTYEESLDGANWNEGYKGSSGVRHEDICSHVQEEGALAALQKSGFVKTVLCGHDHINNFIIPYQGVTLAYALKTGAGCYWEPALNGGTVLVYGSDGLKELRHEFVNVDELLKRYPVKK